MVIETNQLQHLLVLVLVFWGAIEGQEYGRRLSAFEWRTWLRTRAHQGALVAK